MPDAPGVGNPTIKNLSITYVLPVYWPVIGGCELHTHELVTRLSEVHDIKVITQITRQEDKPEYLWSGTLTNPIPLRESYNDNKALVIPIHMNSLERYFLYPFVRYYHRMERPSMAIILHIFKKKLIDHIKGSSLVHCIHNGASFYGNTVLKCARSLRIPFVFTPLLHLYQLWRKGRFSNVDSAGSWQELIDTEAIESYLSPRAYHDKYWFEICKSADALITMTEFEREFFIKKGISPNKIHEVGVGPVISRKWNGKEFRDKYNIKACKFVLFLGRKHEDKGIEEALKSMAYVWQRHPDIYFVFIGPKEGNSSFIFEQYADSHIIDIDQADLYEKTSALEACDILCMPSFYEALGSVFLEAWAFGKPVIAGNTPPLKELTGYGQGGLLVNLEPRDIAEKVILLLENEDLCKKMGAWGKSKVSSKYSWERITCKIETLYTNLLKDEW